jgi:DNA-binding XRE family transcriptional regulator
MKPAFHFSAGCRPGTAAYAPWWTPDQCFGQGETTKVCDVENAKDAAPTLRFGQHIRRLRLERGLTQTELAELAEIHRTYVSSLEHGRRNVSLGLIYRLADGLGVRVTELFPQG